MKRKFNELKNHFRYDIKGRTSCWDRLSMDTLLRSRQRNGTLKTKNITFLDDVISLFFLSLCVVCHPARCFCPKWLFSCKEPRSLGPQSSPKRLSSLLAFKNTPIVLKLRTFFGSSMTPPNFVQTSLILRPSQKTRSDSVTAANNCFGWLSNLTKHSYQRKCGIHWNARRSIQVNRVSEIFVIYRW